MQSFKLAERHVSVALLVGYLVYLGFHTPSIPHAIIAVSLAGLYAFHKHLQQQEQPSMDKALAELRSQFMAELEQQKESHGKTVAKLEGEVRNMSDEMSKVSLSITRVASPKSPIAPNKFNF
jgi:hypothetical protein